MNTDGWQEEIDAEEEEKRLQEQFYQYLSREEQFFRTGRHHFRGERLDGWIARRYPAKPVDQYSDEEIRASPFFDFFDHVRVGSGLRTPPEYSEDQLINIARSAIGEMLQIMLAEFREHHNVPGIERVAERA